MSTNVETSLTLASAARICISIPDRGLPAPRCTDHSFVGEGVAFPGKLTASPTMLFRSIFHHVGAAFTWFGVCSFLRPLRPLRAGASTVMPVRSKTRRGELGLFVALFVI